MKADQLRLVLVLLDEDLTQALCWRRPLFRRKFFFFFQAEDGIRDVAVTWSSDVCSSDLPRGGQHRPRHGLVDVNADRSQEVTVEQLMAILGASVAQLRVEHLGELVGYGLVFRVDELRDRKSVV